MVSYFNYSPDIYGIYTSVCHYNTYMMMGAIDLQESNVKLKLTVVESAGFGDQIDKSDRQVFSIIVKFVGY